MFKETFARRLAAFVKSKPDEYPEVWIDVRGGHADVIHKPKGIIVIVKDWDTGSEDVYTAQDEVEV